MTTAEIIGLLVALGGFNLVAVIGSTWKLSREQERRFTTLEVKLAPLENASERLRELEVRHEILNARVQRIPCTYEERQQ